MPEYPEINVQVDSMVKGTGCPLPLAEYQELEYFFVPCPTSFSTGTEKRRYTSLTVRNEMSIPDPTDEDFEFYKNCETITTPSIVPAEESPQKNAETINLDSQSVELLSPGSNVLTSNENGMDSDSIVAADPSLFDASMNAISTDTSPFPTVQHSLTKESSSVFKNDNSLVIQPEWMVHQLKEFGWPPKHWLNPKSPWNYLLNMKNFVPGRLICSLRGKLLLVAAGQHALTNSLVLEGHWVGMRPELFYQIIRNDVDGSNSDPDKANKMRTFLIPERLNVPNSSPTAPRTIRIFAAFVSSAWVHVLCDFSRLVRMQVVSKDSVWTAEELAVASPTWRHMFEGFKGGPDWVSERSLASESLRNWRYSVLEEAKIYRDKIDEIQRDYKERLEKSEEQRKNRISSKRRKIRSDLKDRLISDMFPRNHVAAASLETNLIEDGHKSDNPRKRKASNTNTSSDSQRKRRKTNKGEKIDSLHAKQSNHKIRKVIKAPPLSTNVPSSDSRQKDPTQLDDDPTEIPLPKFPTPKVRPIIKEICNNSLGAFSGFGRHCANDFLFQMAIHPGTPSHIICSDDNLFEKFEANIHIYISSFTKKEFFKQVTPHPSKDRYINPFIFDDRANRRYMRYHIHAFRRQRAIVPRNLGRIYCDLGLLDPEHTIGEPYPKEKADAMFSTMFSTAKDYVYVPVNFYDKPLRAYGIILAKPPPEYQYNLGSKPVKRDITDFGYATTIGIVQFREYVLNRIYIKDPEVRPGRPGIIHTGRRGRPKKSVTTKSSVKRSQRNNVPFEDEDVDQTVMIEELNEVITIGFEYPDYTEDNRIEDEEIEREEIERNGSSQNISMIYDVDRTNPEDEDENTDDNEITNERFDGRVDLDIRFPTTHRQRNAIEEDYTNLRNIIAEEISQNKLAYLSDPLPAAKESNTKGAGDSRKKILPRSYPSRTMSDPSRTMPAERTADNSTTDDSTNEYRDVGNFVQRRPGRKVLTYGARDYSFYDTVEELLEAALDIVSKPYKSYMPNPGIPNPYSLISYDQHARAPGNLLTYGRAYWLLTKGTPRDYPIFLKHGWQGRSPDVAYRVDEDKRKQIIPKKKDFDRRKAFIESLLHKPQEAIK